MDTPLCSPCSDKHAQYWPELDPDISANRKLTAMKRLAEVLDGGLKSALKVYTARYEMLRESSPNCFELSHDEYWAGFCS